MAAATLAEPTSEGAFGTGANSARISRARPLETLAKTKMSELAATDLSSPADGLGVLAFRGVDAARFLQGQLSADVEKLADGASSLAGLHNPQGRVIVILALLRTSPEEVLAVLPRQLCAAVEQRLRKYILRAQVKIEDLSREFVVVGSMTGNSDPKLLTLPWGDRWLLLVPAARPGEFAGKLESPEAWKRADIAAGLPMVYPATSETFVAQMLNLDLLGGIAFDKGCYTGQEVIARAHYRGRVKRRLQRWHGTGNYVPRAGDSVRSRDGRALTVVRAVGTGAHDWEILAVGPFASVNADAAAATAVPESDETLIQVEGPLPLPYSLPE
jgi:tRNA-modifying protein YgfZ